MKGCYCLIIKMQKESKIKIGRKLGTITFKKGCYVYVGSAMNSLEARLTRHMSKEKKLHWHIDYLTKHINSEVCQIIYNEDKKVECELSCQLSQNTSSVKSFGCSDCMCESHLYYFVDEKEAIENVKKAYNTIKVPYDYYI